MTHPRRTSALVGLGYAAIAFAYFGIRIVSHPERYLIGSDRDPQIFVWDFAWWPHAILTWQNPFFSHAIYAPSGINMAWVTGVPALAIAFAPVTLLFGPDVSYNLAELLMPACSAFTAYLLCRHLTRSTWAAIVGGYLYGFSSYVLGQEVGHLNLTSVFLLPLIALTTVRYLQGELDGRGLAWRLGVLFGLEFWISTELCVNAAIALGFALLLAYATLPGVRPRLRALPRPLGAAFALAAMITAPLLYYALTGFQSESIIVPSTADGDVMNLLVPTRLIAVGGSTFASTSAKFFSDLPDQGLYLGIPTLVIVAWFALGARRSAARRFAIAALLGAVALTLGTGLYVDGHDELALPWKWVAKLPILDNVLPVRFSIYVALAGAVIVALWIASTPGRIFRCPYVLPVLAVAALMPPVWQSDFRLHPERWSFFTTGLYKSCIPRNDNVAIFPFGVWDYSTLWQAESDFWFRMPEGYLTITPPAASMRDPTVRDLTYTLDKPTIPQIIELVKDEKVDRILTIVMYVQPKGTLMWRFGEVSAFPGILIAPGCGYPSLRQGIHAVPRP